EAMAEKQVTIGDTSYTLEKPFLVLATQNPLEQEGTYPLPEAQMDRFMFKIVVDYPKRAEEMEILNRMSTDKLTQIETACSKEDLLRARDTADTIYVDEKIKNYIVELVMSTREPKEHGLSQLIPMIQVGASPRATISL